MIECKICNKTMSSNIATHLKSAHKITLSDYYDMFFKKDDSEGLCKCCNRPTEFYKLSFGYKQYCSNECRTTGSIVKYGTYNNRRQAISTCKDRFNGKLNSGAWNTRKENINSYCRENNCTALKELLEIYGQGWLTLDIPKIYVNKQNVVIENKYLTEIENYANTYHASLTQQRLKDFICSFYSGEVLQNIRNIIKPKELDIYLPKLKLAIEFNGTHWHSSELNCPINEHLQKSLRCRELNIRLIHIYEFENLEEQYQLLKDLINGEDKYHKKDFNKNNLITNIPKPAIIYTDLRHTIYGSGELMKG